MPYLSEPISQEDGISKKDSPTVQEVPEVPISQGSKDSDPMSDPMSQENGITHGIYINH